MANLATTSTIWPNRKSALREFIEDKLVVGQPLGSLSPTRKQINAAGQGLRAGGESLLVGGALGAAHAHLKGGLDFKGVPIDAVAGIAGLIGGTLGADEEIGRDLANAGAAALAVFAFRKVHDLTAEVKLKQSGATAGGGAATGQIRISKAQFGAEGRSGILGRGRANANASFNGEDPIVAAARGLK
jgi:hypothetical protein